MPPPGGNSRKAEKQSRGRGHGDGHGSKSAGRLERALQHHGGVLQQCEREHCDGDKSNPGRKQEGRDQADGQQEQKMLSNEKS